MVRAILIPYLLISLIICWPMDAQAQAKKDSVEKKSAAKKAFHEGVKLISASQKDTIVNEKSVDPYSEYVGRHQQRTENPK